VKRYRMNSFMAGLLYLLGTVFGVLSTVVGGEVISSIVQSSPLSNTELIRSVTAEPDQLLNGAFCILLMGMSLIAMTVFLYPVIQKDSKELAVGMLLFRGALEGTWYILSALVVVVLFVIGVGYSATSPDAIALQSMITVAYQFQDRLAPIGPLFFLIGTTCIYVSFYRTTLIPRWLSVWGLIGVGPYFLYALMHYFQVDSGIGFYLQMILAPQEVVMALWLMIKGFNPSSLELLVRKAHDPLFQ